MDKNQRAHALHQWLKQSIICPITKMVIKDPVLATDGIIYERQAIEKWFVQSKNSPSTGLPIETDLVHPYFFKNLVEKFLEYKPKIKIEQYQIQKLNHCDNLEAIRKIFKNNAYKQLLNYHHFSLKFLGALNNEFIRFLRTTSIDIFQYVVENIHNLEVELFSKKRLIHLVADARRSDLVIYLVDKGVILTTSDIFGMRPVHYVFKKCNLEAIKCLFDKNVSLEVSNNDGKSPIHFIIFNRKITDIELLSIIDKFSTQSEYDTNDKTKPIHLACRYRGEKIINYLLDKEIPVDCSTSNNIYPIHYLLTSHYLDHNEKIKLLDRFKNLEYENSNRQRPIHIACNMIDNDMIIKYLVDRGVDINCEDSEKWRPIHYLCHKKPSVPMILYFLEKNIDLECATNTGKKPIHFLARPSTLTIAKLLQEHGAKIEDLEMDDSQIDYQDIELDVDTDDETF